MRHHPQQLGWEDASKRVVEHSFVTIHHQKQPMAPLKLRILIVGSGIGGISAAYCLARTGHEVIVLESASALREVGAGIQISPNASRLLIRWGLGSELDKVAVRPQTLSFCRYDNGERIGFTLFGNKMARDHGAPYYHIHRADLFNMLLEKALPFITLRLNAKVIAVDPMSVSVTLASGETLSGDLIIGADGLKSIVRDVVSPSRKACIATGDAAFRAVVPVESLRQDEQLRGLIETPQVHCWMGPDRHVVSYCIKGGEQYNIVMIYPDNGAVESWSTPGNVDDTREIFSGWEPRIQKLLSLVKANLQGKIMVHPPLKTWVHVGGCITLLGDACHPMLPYRAQGSAMAIEDAAVLGNLFSRITQKSQIAPLLHAYESLRRPRATATQDAAYANRNIFHMPDGPAQEARDASMRVAMAAALQEQAEWMAQEQMTGDQGVPESNFGNANAWADRAKNEEQFSYDADVAVEEWWSRYGAAILEGDIDRVQAKL